MCPLIAILFNMKEIERTKGFPIIAWAVIVLFALFTFNLTNYLADTTERLDPNYGVAGVQY